LTKNVWLLHSLFIAIRNELHTKEKLEAGERERERERQTNNVSRMTEG
jgi:hypothetical protein